MKILLVAKSTSQHAVSMQFLTKQEREQLQAQHRFERDRRICDRIKAILLYDKGWTFPEIAEALLLSEGAIRNHIKEYQSHKKLRPEGGGSMEKLSDSESSELEKHLLEYTYLHVTSIVAYVNVRFGHHYSIPGMTSWLKRHGFSYKKPKLVPGKADKDEQQKWIDAYAKFKANLPGDETICFTDGVHPTHNVQLGYGWIKKGVDKLIPANTGRSRLNLTGSIDILSYEVFLQEDKTLNADATIRFFQSLEQHYSGKTRIHVFCDNAPYYRNREVTKYLKNSKIQLHFLPPYSPNLNPIERLWKWMKETVVYNTYYSDFYEFRQAIFGFFRTLSGLDPGSTLGSCFRSRVGDRFRAMGAPATP